MQLNEHVISNRPDVELQDLARVLQLYNPQISQCKVDSRD